METLEIKHLAAYLPYKIKIRVFRENESLFIEDVEITGEVIDYIFETKEYSKYKYKPILRPLSDLTKEIEVYGKRFVPIVELLKLSYPIWFKEKNGTRYDEIGVDGNGYPRAWVEFQATLSIMIITSNLLNEKYWIIEKLISWHFDIFGLIDKGLAININELESMS